MKPDRLPTRRISTAELLAVGSELTSGETRDTNGGELARSLSLEGVAVRRITALPDELDLVSAHFRDALETVDLVVATGGLGPTPDDLTREAIAAVVGEEPTVDPALEAWLRALFGRRGIALPELNLKQAWLIPSATSIPNANGTAPGWWVERPDGRLAVLLPGPPRELRPMWSDWVLPRLRERGLGDGRLVRTLRTYGIGESHVAELLGERMLRAPNPVIATYARADWLDVRIAAVDERDPDGGVTRNAAEVLEASTAAVRSILAGHVMTEGETSWADLVAGPPPAPACGSRSSRRAPTAPSGCSWARSRPSSARSPSALPSTPTSRRGGRSRGGRGRAGGRRRDRPGPGGPQRRHPDAASGGGRRPFGGLVAGAGLRLFQHGAHGRFRAGVAAAAFLAEVLGEDR